MKPKLAPSIFILLVLSAVGWWGYDTLKEHREGKAREKQQTERRLQIEAKVAAFSRRYDAITNWEETFTRTKGKQLLRIPFSVEIEGVMAKPEGRPILITGFIEDVTRRGDKFDLHIYAWGTGSADIKFLLECDHELTERVLNRPSAFSRFAFITKIISIEKAAFKLKSGHKTTEDDPPIEVDLSDVFIARGHCLDLMLMDDE